jgi:predicted AAA+ superfamily ATPase
MISKNNNIGLFRKIDGFLELWRSNPRRLPLIVKGARQVGKTYCIRRFAKHNYKRLVEINFVERPEFKSIVRDGFSVASIVRNITAIDPGMVFESGSTLVFLDEIQAFPEIATALKFFAEDGRFDVVCSGSILGVHYKRVSSFSVGYQESVVMRSLDFEEFLFAHGYTEDQIEDVYRFIVDGRSLPDAVLETFGRLFIEYCACGGMPEVVAAYIEDGTFANVRHIQNRLVSDYREDIRKYSEGLDSVRIERVFNSLPAQLAKENKKFQLSRIERGARRKDYWGCVEWLKDAGVVNLCYKMSFPELPVKGNVDFDFYKLYMADSGLLLSLVDEYAREDVLVRRNLGTWKGGFFENVIGEALVKAGAELVYYKRDNSSLEMDFFLRSKDCLVPIEVKSENGQSKSLKTLIESDHYPDIRWGVKLINGNVGFDGKVRSIPQWSAFLLPRLMKDWDVCPS